MYACLILGFRKLCQWNSHARSF